MKKIFSVLLACFALGAQAQTHSSEKLVPYVRPIIGTQRMGHVYPGAT
nr:hypothetical protein [Mucilaginibacter sp. FT3.2]